MMLKQKQKSKSLSELALSKVERLRKQRSDILHQKACLHDALPDDVNDNVIEHCFSNAENQIHQKATEGIQLLQYLRDKKQESLKSHRQFQYEHGVDRPVRHPDLLMTISIILIFWFVETILSTGLFVADGMFDIIIALATAMVISCVTTLLASTAGFFAGRYIEYKINTPIPLARDRNIRKTAWVGLGCACFSLAMLHFGAARVRATHEMDKIFDFSEVGFFTTFGDYFALALIACGIVNAVISFYKGRHGFSDFIVGYSQISNDTEKMLNQNANDLYQEILDQIDECFDESCEDLKKKSTTLNKDIIAYQKSYRDLQQITTQHNNEIATEIDYLCIIEAEQIAQEEYVYQKATKHKPSANYIATLEALSVEVMPEYDARLAIKSVDIKSGLARIQNADQTARSHLSKAHLDFLNPITLYSFNQLGGNYEEA